VVAEIRRLAIDLARSTANRCELVAAGLAVPGFVDPASGIALAATNIGWHDVPLRRLLAGDLDLPVAVDHDVKSAGLAEARLGHGQHARDFAFVAIGTGIATAIVVDGIVLRGGNGRAGELGHVPVHPGGAVCKCGRMGCLEAYASAAAIARRYREASGNAYTAAQVAARWGTDPIAATVWSEAIAALALALVTYVALLDPQLVVLGGGVSQAGPALIGPLSARLSALTGAAPPPIRISRLGVDAGLLGAAILAWHQLGRSEVVEEWARRRVAADA
jgi:glucokinase